MPVGVAFADGQLVVQTRAPASLMMPERDLTVQHEVLARSEGHLLFHIAPNGTVACASCHPEGREDAHVWNFAEIGPRRTQPLRVGGLSQTLPLHWDGDMADMAEIMDEVFVRRMGGKELSEDNARSVADWLDGLPALPPLRDPADPAAARGKTLFHSAQVGCITCHSGPRFTNNESRGIQKPIATGKLQVPSLLGVAWRLPVMHDGCATNLRDRFDLECGGYDHGDISQLSEADLDDLVAYLETL
jgi:cytochrome c peroxidase